MLDRFVVHADNGDRGDAGIGLDPDILQIPAGRRMGGHRLDFGCVDGHHIGTRIEYQFAGYTADQLSRPAILDERIQTGVHVGV